MKKIILIFALVLIGCDNQIIDPRSDLVIEPVSAVTKESIKSPESAKIVFVGDMMFDRSIRQIGNRKGYEYIFSEVSSYFQTADLVVGNLEGPITDFKSVSLGTVYESSGSAHFTFTFDPQIAPTLKQSGFDLLNLGNNHILNFGQAGASQTKDYLEKSQIASFGYVNLTQQSTYQTQLASRKLVFANWNQFSDQNLKSFLEQLKRLDKEADILIVYTHWSEEYQFNPTPGVRTQAHQMIDAGADVIIGTHPHIIGEVEEYRGKQIYYSLGNFVFDQYFSKETTEGLVVEMNINSADSSIYFNHKKIKILPSGQTVFID